jgi:RNase adaptor protein for sRNA GlmZ degradation
MSKSIVQFGFKKHHTIEETATIDCRVLRNPYKEGVPDEELIAKVRLTEGFEDLVQEGVQLLAKHDIIYVGCMYGKHRSGAVAQEIARLVPDCTIIK